MKCCQACHEFTFDDTDTERRYCVNCLEEQRELRSQVSLGDQRLAWLCRFVEQLCDVFGFPFRLTSVERDGHGSVHTVRPVRGADLSVVDWPGWFVGLVVTACDIYMPDPRGRFRPALFEFRDTPMGDEYYRVQAIMQWFRQRGSFRARYTLRNQAASGPHIHLQVYAVETPGLEPVKGWEP